MRTLWMSTGLGIVAMCCATPSFGADGPEQNGPSAASWVVLLLPTLIMALLIYFVLRNARRNKVIVDRRVEQFEEHQRFTEDHMKRLESQVELLNDRLGRVVELLTAIERSQRQDRG